jgi:hypothetical protein
MNTFVERRIIDSRLMFWLAALHGIDGMLCVFCTYFSLLLLFAVFD